MRYGKFASSTTGARIGPPGASFPRPFAGDRAAWAPRLEQGMPTLLAHTVSGYKGMPPLGSCSDCGEDDFTALIEFMSLGKGAATP